MTIETRSLLPELNYDLSTFLIGDGYLNVTEMLTLRSVSHQCKKFIDCTQIWDLVAQRMGITKTTNKKHPFEVIQKIYQFYFKKYKPNYCVYNSASTAASISSTSSSSSASDKQSKKSVEKNRATFNFHDYDQKKERKWVEIMSNTDFKVKEFLVRSNAEQNAFVKARFCGINNVEITSIKIDGCFPYPVLFPDEKKEEMKNLYSLTVVKTEYINYIKIFHENELLKSSHQNQTPLPFLPVFPGLSHDQFLIIPKEIEKLTQLRYLKISNSLFIPSEIKNLTNLTELDISNNKLKKIKFVTGLLSLNKLVVDDNELKNIPVGLSKLTNLEYLSLTCNKIRKISLNFEELASLKTLSIADNDLTKVNLPSLKKLKILNLSDNPINEISGLESLVALEQLVILGVADKLKRLPRDCLKLESLKSLIYDSEINFDEDEKIFLKTLEVRMNEKGLIPQEHTPPIILKPRNVLKQVNCAFLAAVKANENVLSKQKELIKKLEKEKEEKERRTGEKRRRTREMNKEHQRNVKRQKIEDQQTVVAEESEDENSNESPNDTFLGYGFCVPAGQLVQYNGIPQSHPMQYYAPSQFIHNATPLQPLQGPQELMKEEKATDNFREQQSNVVVDNAAFQSPMQNQNALPSSQQLPNHNDGISQNDLQTNNQGIPANNLTNQGNNGMNNDYGSVEEFFAGIDFYPENDPLVFLSNL